MKSIFHQEIGGGYAMGPKIIVDTCELETGIYETMAMNENGEEFECKRSASLEQAEKDFYEILMNYAEPLQKSVLGANLKNGGKYTLFRYSEFGFPMAYKFTYCGSVKCITYAQYRDAVDIILRPAHKKGDRRYLLYNGSFAICEGWQELPMEVTHDIVGRNRDNLLLVSRYGSFDLRYFEDIKKILKNVVVVYEKSKVTADGRRIA